MKAFVTGGTGFVGSHLVEALLAQGAEVRALVRGKPKWLRGLDVIPVPGDLFRLGALAEGVRGVDVVYHVAGLTRARDQRTLDRANVDGTLSVLRAVQAHAPEASLLVTSSLEAMGPCRETAAGTPIPHTEADPPRPASMYGRSKWAMERALWAQRGDVRAVVVRPPAVYGPRETDIFEVVKGASRGLFPVVGHPDEPRLSLVHVRDLVRGMIAAAQSLPQTDGETYFISSERGYSWQEVRAAIEAALGRRTLKLPVPRWAIRPAGALAEGAGALVGKLPPLTRDKAEAARHGWVCSIEKAQAELGYEPAVGLADGMAETVAWYRREGWLK